MCPEVYIMEMLTTLFRAKLTQGLADFWVAANAIKARTKIRYLKGNFINGCFPVLRYVFFS
jgi:hypothetical protein